MRKVIEQGDELVNSNGLKILVPIKQVPRTEEIALDGAGRLIRHGVDLEINAFCRRAITKAVDIAHERGGTVTAVTMGPPQAAAAIREAIAAGADEGYLLSDPGLAGSDTLVTAQVLARFVAEFGPFSMITDHHNRGQGDRTIHTARARLMLASEITSLQERR